MLTLLLSLIIAGLMVAAYKKVGTQPIYTNTGLNIVDDFVTDFATPGSHTYKGLFFSGSADLNGVVESDLAGNPDYLGTVRLFTAISADATAHLTSNQKFATEGSSYIDIQTRHKYTAPLLTPGEVMEKNFGISDDITDQDASTDCAVIYHDSAVSDYYICLVKNSNDGTTLQEQTDVLATTDADTYFRIIVNANVTYFYINNTLVATIQGAPAPVVGGLSIGWGMVSRSTSDNHPMVTDAILVRQELLNPRQFV